MPRFGVNLQLKPTMDAWLSPSYKHDKLDNPSFQDLVDVFEDLWFQYVFKPVEALLAMPHGDIAAMSLLSSYFEAAESYRSGLSSKRRSKEFFVKAFSYVYRADQTGIEKATAVIYEHIRCGLAHEGMVSCMVHYTRFTPKAFLLTYRKKPDGLLDIDAGVVSIIVNPLRMYEGVQKHFAQYIAALRSEADSDLCDAFKATVERQWALVASELMIGMSEAEFQGGL